MRSPTRGYLHLVASLLLLPATGCSAPTLTQLEPAAGPARSLVSIVGSETTFASVVWDAGTAAERVLPVSLGGTMFSVPHDATPGPHAVVLQRDAKRSQPLQFNVVGATLTMPRPRIDHVMILDPQFDAVGVDTTLYVSGANFDVGAVVLINGSPVATVAHKALLNDLYGVPQDVLDYPIHHYVSVLAAAGPRPPGSVLSVTVRNPDAAVSHPATYTVPESLAGLDSDGDSLPDSLETAGIDADGDGTSDTHVHRRDILVEIDIMQPPPGAEEPALDPTAAFTAARAMFAAAPFLNPYTNNGINLVIDASGTVRAVDTVIFDIPDNTGSPPNGVTTVAFSTLKSEGFDAAARGDAFHYVIWANRVQNDLSGWSDMPPEKSAFLPGDDTVIGVNAKGASFQSTRSQAEVLVHELGHNLGQKHGGATDEVLNPNQWTVMSYAWLLRTGITDPQRVFRATCLPFYYAAAGADEPGNKPPPTVTTTIDYSAGMAARIVESGHRDEADGVCGQPVDFGHNGSKGDEVGAFDVNDNAKQDTIDDFANWPALILNGPKSNGDIP